MCSRTITRRITLALSLLLPLTALAGDTVKLGFNYPRTGAYFAEGLDQLRAAQLALEEVNASGGILGKKAELVIRDTRNDVPTTRKNALELIEKEGVSMLFGGSSSAEAVAMGEVAQQKGVPFFGTLTYSNSTTGSDGHRYTFRECYSAWMGAKVLSKHLNARFAGKKYFYITADYNWGWTTEESLRVFTRTSDVNAHPRVKVPFPISTAQHYKAALREAEKWGADVLVLVLFGQDMVNTINIASGWGLNKKMQIVVPNITLAMAEAAGPANMAGVLGAVPWSWEVPYKYGYERGIEFVEKFAARYGRYPSTSGASAYVIVHQYRDAVQRAGSLDGARVVKALEGHSYTMLKDPQVWRDFDHQSLQSVFAVRGNPADVVVKDKYKLAYFEIIDSLSGAEAAKTRAEWNAERKSAGKPTALEKLPGDDS